MPDGGEQLGAHPSSGWARDERYAPTGSSTELAQRLHDEGLVYAINRLVLHPIGLALGVAGELVGEHQVKVAGIVLFLTDDPEGIVYDATSEERGRGKLAHAGHVGVLRAVEALPDP